VNTYEDFTEPHERIAFAFERYNLLHPQNDSPDVRDYSAFVKVFVDVEILHAKVKWLGELKEEIKHVSDDAIRKQLLELTEKVILLRRECHNRLKETED
jgi:hypothetical protein